MATKRQISELIKYAMNNERENLLGLTKQLASSEKNSRHADELKRFVRYGERQLTSQEGVTVTHSLVETDRESSDFFYQIHESKISLETLVLPKSQEEKLRLWISELKNMDLLEDFKIPVDARGIFHGHTGTGKTMAAYCVAHELRRPLFIVNLSSIVSSKLGQTSRNLNFVFRIAQERNAILFLDEIDFFAKSRDSIQDHGEARRALISLLQILDLIPQNLIVIGATNLLNSVDPAVIRRFGFKLEFGLPNKLQTKAYILKLMQQYKLDFNKPKIDSLAKYFSGKDYVRIRTEILGTLKQKLIKNREINMNSISLNEIKEFSKRK